MYLLSALVTDHLYRFLAVGYKYGFRVTSSNNNKVLLTLNARNEHDRSRFVDDLNEAILEVSVANGVLSPVVRDCCLDRSID